MPEPVPAGEVLVVTGPPGAGKSTVAPLVLDHAPLGVLLDGDSFLQSVRRGWVPPWEPRSRRQNEVCTEVIGLAAGRWASGGYAVVVEGILGPWLLDRLVTAAAAPVHYVVLRPSAEVAMTRAVARGEPWLVDPAPIAQMYEAFADLGLHERHVVDTTDQDAAATATEVVVRLAAGTLRLC